MVQGYSAEGDPDRSAKAAARDEPMSFRHAIEVCSSIRGMEVPDAKEYLEKVIDKEEPILLKRHDRGAGHRKGGKGPGRFPVKVAESVLSVLENAENNAEYKGLDPDRMFVDHAAAQKGAVLEGQKPRAQGRSTPWNTTMTHIEMIITEREEEL